MYKNDVENYKPYCASIWVDSRCLRGAKIYSEYFKTKDECYEFFKPYYGYNFHFRITYNGLLMKSFDNDIILY